MAFSLMLRKSKYASATKIVERQQMVNGLKVWKEVLEVVNESGSTAFLCRQKQTSLIEMMLQNVAKQEVQD